MNLDYIVITAVALSVVVAIRLDYYGCRLKWLAILVFGPSPFEIALVSWSDCPGVEEWRLVVSLVTFGAVVALRALYIRQCRARDWSEESLDICGKLRCQHQRQPRPQSRLDWLWDWLPH